MSLWLGILGFCIGCTSQTTPVETYEMTTEVQERRLNDIETERQIETEIFADDSVIDISTYGKNMAYAEMYNLYGHLDEEMGKTLKITGIFEYVDQEEPIFLCIIQDQMGCCGIPVCFDPEDVYTYPEDYPERGEEITVSGTIQKKKNEKGYDELYLSNTLMNQ